MFTSCTGDYDRGSINFFTIYGDRSPDNGWHIIGKIDESDLKHQAGMIRRYPKSIPTVRIHGVQEATPEYLALLIAVLNKAESLNFDSLGGDAAYGCFMGSMLQRNCLRELHVEWYITTTYQAKLLFEGIAVCQSLEKLTLDGQTFATQEVVMALANALKRKQSLRTLTLHTIVGDTFTEIFQSAITDTKLEEFSIHNSRRREELSFNVMVDELFTDKCTVKKLTFTAFAPATRSLSESSNNCVEPLYNKSVTSYALRSTRLDCAGLMDTASLFRFIQELNLSDNCISDLSPLDPLLIGDRLTLKTLYLTDNIIRENDAIQFFRKFPQMTCLRKVSLVYNPFVECTNAWKDLLVDVAWKNRSLEYINCIHRVANEDDDDGYFSYPNGFFPELNVPLSLNRGGRRGVELESSAPLPANLWPHVLERASKLSYFDHDCEMDFEMDFEMDCEMEDDDLPSLYSTRRDVVFWLVKEKMLGKYL